MSKTNRVYNPSFLIIIEGDPKGWCTVLITALGSWKQPVPCGHLLLLLVLLLLVLLLRVLLLLVLLLSQKWTKTKLGPYHDGQQHLPAGAVCQKIEIALCGADLRVALFLVRPPGALETPSKFNT
jgi:hypothetical protein